MGVRWFNRSVVRLFLRLKNSRDSTDSTTVLDRSDECAVYLDSHASLEEVDRND